MSLRVFSFGNNEVEAAESARLGLEKMEREIRAAYPVDSNDPDNMHLFFSADGSPSNPPQAMPAASQITFGNDLGDADEDGVGDADHKIECPNPNGDCEYITYKLSAPSNAAPCSVAPGGCSTLLRVNTANWSDAGDPVVENVVPGGLTFTYFESEDPEDPDEVPDLATCEEAIGRVLVSLEVEVNPGTDAAGTQELTTEIDLRNRQGELLCGG
jgi:hypothetical protein